MDEKKLLPVLDLNVLQEKANEYAMKGAQKALEDFYSGYNSPYVKSIEEELKNKKLSGGIELPDIIALINDKLTKEIDLIANTAVSKTFVPLVQKFLLRQEKEMTFYDILEKLVELTIDDDKKNIEDYSVDIERPSGYSWLDVTFNIGDKTYQVTFHEDWQTKNEPVKKYQILSLPRNYDTKYQMMKLKVEDATLELPFTPSVLEDDVMSFIAGLVIANTKITMNCQEFQEEMFPERCHCD